MLATMESLGLIREFFQNLLGVVPKRITPEARDNSPALDWPMQRELMFIFGDRFGITLGKDLEKANSVGNVAWRMDRLRCEQA